MAERKGNEELNFEEALAQEPQRLKGEVEKIVNEPRYRSYEHQKLSYLGRGYYAAQLNGWLAYFSRNQLLIIFSEDFYKEPDKVYQQVLKFLGLQAFSLRSYEVHNAAQDEHPLEENIREKLRQEFDQPNQDLKNLLGGKLPW